MRRGSVVQWLAIIVLAAIIAVAVWFFVFERPARQQPAPIASNPPPAAAANTVPKHPVSSANVPASATTAPLPTLPESDDSVLQALLALPGAQGLADLLVKQAIVPNIVATVDALPRQSFGSARILPLRVPGGTFTVEQNGDRQVISAQNYGRYDAYMQVLESVDSKALVAWYVRDYPLFQQAYRDLGYPKGYFNDRLVAVIDNLLAAPEPAQPPAVQHQGAFYVYVDPALESLGAGQKMLIHSGPRNEARIKAKLREVRALLVGQALPSGRS
ncbi:MAG TPA: DUF3014 domain-containing protein [Rhodanobacteraceae bacterium]|nr:DUF3014 domain-containing protein [Rhodanobacteraceae bacterium]